MSSERNRYDDVINVRCSPWRSASSPRPGLHRGARTDVRAGPSIAGECGPVRYCGERWLLGGRLHRERPHVGTGLYKIPFCVRRYTPRVIRSMSPRRWSFASRTWCRPASRARRLLFSFRIAKHTGLPGQSSSPRVWLTASDILPLFWRSAIARALAVCCSETSAFRTTSFDSRSRRS